MINRAASRSFILLIALVIFLAPGQNSFAQTYGNEWIVPNQTYYKVQVASTGLYAISFNQMRTAGIPISPLGSVLPQELQLFHRGVEQALMIRNDSMFFYGKRNDGTLDSLLYKPYSKQPHKYYNLYSDTTSYFITWASGAAGKRMAVSNLGGTGSTDQYHLAEELLVLSDDYSFGSRYSLETFMSYGDEGEGWFGPWIWTNGVNPSTATYTLNTPNVFASGPNAELEIMLVGRNGWPGSMIHRPTVLIGNPNSPSFTFNLTPFAFHEVKKFTFSIPLSQLTSGNITVSVRNNGDGSTPSGISIAYMKLKYAQTYNAAGQSEKYYNSIPNASQSFISIPNAPAGSLLFDITQSNNVGLISTVAAGANLSATLPSSSNGRSIYLAGPASFRSVSKIELSDLRNFTNENSAEYIVITNKKIINGARQIAEYRKSNQGGGYDTVVAEVQKLYDIFSYGEKSPIAIRRFMEYLFNVGDPKYLFIVGKGLVTHYNVGGNGFYRRDPVSYINHPDPEFRREDMIPSFGVPPSDLLYVTGLNGAPENVAAIPVGRFSVQSNQDIINYLDKVKEHELTGKDIWRKHLLHLSGGNTPQEKLVFLGIVNQLKSRAEDTLFAGKVVSTISKKGSSSVDDNLIESVVDVVNQGVSYITFFGHSSNATTDLDIGWASRDIYGYKNKGKYPFMVVNGCNSAQTFRRISFVEDFMATKDRGALGAVGHTDAGYVEELKNYSNIFYKNAFQTRSLLGKPVGDVHLGTMKEFANIYGTSGPVYIATLHQMLLLADPALRVYTPELPDYAINDNTVSIKSLDGKTVTAVSDSFAIQIVVSNFGVSFADSLKVHVRRIINGKITEFPVKIYRSVSYLDTLLFVIRSNDVANYGLNIFEITIDPGNNITESDENNNFATLRYFMPLSAVAALFPKEYSIVSSNPVTFIAQSTNLLVGPTEYYFEVDTSHLFNSPIKIASTPMVVGNSLVKWQNISLPVLQDSLVYYWRVRLKNIGIGEDTLYGESSFIYINGSPPGWSQSEFPQFTKDILVNLNKSIEQKKWSFNQSIASLFVKSYGSGDPNAWTKSTVRINGVVYEFGGWCTDNSLLSIAFRGASAKPYTPYPPPNGSMCGISFVPYLNYFNQLHDGVSGPSIGSQNQANLIEYIDNIPTGDYVIFASNGNVFFDSWTTTLKDKFKNELGAQQIDNLTSGMPYILVARKGDSNPVFEIFDSSINAEIILNDTLFGSHDSGTITSTLIGPASSWGTVYRNFKSSEQPVTDQYELKLIRINLDGNPIDTLNLPAHDTIDISGIVNPVLHPYIRLFTRVEDGPNLTPPQLRKWQVIYGGVPEGTMNPSLAGLNNYNTITRQEGDSISICYAFENISDYDFTDSLTVKYTITNSSSGIRIFNVRLKPLKQDSIVSFCYKFSTRGLVGSNVIQAYVNPKILREEYYNNNIIESSFNIERDRIHPILDVVFDGARIMDGDIVSPSPMITITINDENPFLIRNNMEGIEVFLQRPGEAVPQKIDVTSPSFVSAKQVGTNGKNVYQIEYNPQNLPDGVYKLVVKAKDVSGNNSGVLDYVITFEVINKATISNFYPYPNPFSSSTRFVFTLTGSEIPEDLKIQIMTVTGKVVREITKAEIGTIRIGNNKTEYAWDGTDEFGDRLANGVYLYRVIIKNDKFEHRDTAGDKAFKKNFGKLYILR